MQYYSQILTVSAAYTQIHIDSFKLALALQIQVYTDTRVQLQNDMFIIVSNRGNPLKVNVLLFMESRIYLKSNVTVIQVGS